MEKILTKKIETEIRYHQYYCDKCGKLICESEEYDDCWIPNQPNKTIYQIDNYKIQILLCNDCKNKFLNDFYQALERLGFVNE